MNDAALSLVNGIIAIQLTTNSSIRKSNLADLGRAIVQSLVFCPVLHSRIPTLSSFKGKNERGDTSFHSRDKEDKMKSLVAFRLGYREKDLFKVSLDAYNTMSAPKLNGWDQRNDLLHHLLCLGIDGKGSKEDRNLARNLLKNHIFPVMEELDQNLLQLSEENWGMYLLLHPKALLHWLHDMLKEHLEHEKQCNSLDYFRTQFVNSGNLNVRIATAIVKKRELHLIARKQLQHWLVSSGNIVVWELMYTMLELMIEVERSDEKADIGQSVRTLFPVELQDFAEIATGWESYSNHKKNFINECVNRMEDLLRIHEKTELSTYIWQVMLDAPYIIRTAMEIVNLDDWRRITFSRVEIGADITKEDEFSDLNPEVRFKAAKLLAYLLWPHDISIRNVLSNSLNMKGAPYSSLPVLRESVQCLDRWSHVLQNL